MFPFTEVKYNRVSIKHIELNIPLDKYLFQVFLSWGAVHESLFACCEKHLGQGWINPLSGPFAASLPSLSIWFHISSFAYMQLLSLYYRHVRGETLKKTNIFLDIFFFFFSIYIKNVLKGISMVGSYIYQFEISCFAENNCIIFCTFTWSNGLLLL